jgi:hypothetical protein
VNDGLDDIFGAEPAPAAEPTPESLPAPGALDDIFGEPAPAVDPVPAAEPAPAAQPAADALDDIFGGATEEAKPAEPAGDLFDSILDEPAAPAAEPSLDDLFNESPSPTSTDSPEVKEKEKSIFDELFGKADRQAPSGNVTVAAAKASVQSIASSEDRLWIDNSGSFSTQGRLIEITETHIRLLKSTGRTCTVAKSRLSASDAEYVRQLEARLLSDADLVATR